MAGWYVSDSESDNKETTSELAQHPNSDRVISFTLDKVLTENTLVSTRVIELLKSISFNKTLELECTNGYLEPHQHKRKKRKRKKKATIVDGEISESTSEIVSTRTTSTGECRDPRRPSLSTFDYDDEELPALKGTPLLRRKRPVKRNEAKPTLHLFESIEAQIRNDELQEEQQCDIDNNIQPSCSAASLDNGAWSSHNTDNGCCYNNINNKVFNFSFDEDDDYDNTSEPDFAIFSKIRHIEEFLEQSD